MSGAVAPTTMPGEQRELHVGAVERPRQRPRHPRQPAHSPLTSQLLEPEREVVAVHAEAHAGGGEVGGRAVEHHAALQHDHVVEVVGDRAELVRHEEHRGVVLAARGGRASRGTAPATRRRRRRSARRARAARARRRAPWRSARAAAARPRARASRLRRRLGERDRLERVVDGLAVGGAAPPPPPLLGQPPGRRPPPRRWPGGRARCAGAAARTRRASGRGGRAARRRTRSTAPRLRVRAGRAGCAAASTCPSRWARRARRTRRRAPRGSRASSTDLGAVGERHVGRPRAPPDRVRRAPRS